MQKGRGEWWLLGLAVLVSYSTMASVFVRSLPLTSSSPMGTLLERCSPLVVALIVALLAARGHLATPFRRACWVASVACSIAIPLVLLSGAVGDGLPLVSLVLTAVGLVARPVGYTLLWLAWMTLFARLDLRHMLTGYLLVHVASAALSFVLGSLPLPRPVLAATVCVMPWVALVAQRRAASAVDASPFACGESAGHPWSFPLVPVVLMAAFTCVNVFVRGMVPSGMTVYATAGVVASCLAVLLVVHRIGVGRFDVWQLSGISFVLTMAGLLGTHVTGAGWGIAASLCTNAGFALFNVFLSAVLCNISFRYGVSSLILFGFAKAADGAASLLGSALVWGATMGDNTFALMVTGLAIFLSVSFVLLAQGRGDDPAWGIGLAPALQGEGAGAMPDSSRGIETRCAVIARECGLTRREEEVLCLLARDLPASDIEHELCVSNATVKTHTQAVYRKLGVHSRREIVAYVAGQ